MEQKALTSPTHLVLFLIGEGPVVLSSAANYDNIMFNLKCCIIYSEYDFVLFPDKAFTSTSSFELLFNVLSVYFDVLIPFVFHVHFVFCLHFSEIDSTGIHKHNNIYYIHFKKNLRSNEQ
jgi:hypothetical protein